ncbi:MAG: hypothetical protein IPM79_31575 [Polyangiaceae bacterium]|nr:hypothetical protein [Polyangiaceae bacterium]
MPPPIPPKPQWAARAEWRRQHGEDAYQAELDAESPHLAEFRRARNVHERHAAAVDMFRRALTRTPRDP